MPEINHMEKRKVRSKLLSKHPDLLRDYLYLSTATIKKDRLKKEVSAPEFHIIEDESPGSLNRSWARLIPISLNRQASLSVFQ